VESAAYKTTAFHAMSNSEQRSDPRQLCPVSRSPPVLAEWEHEREPHPTDMPSSSPFLMLPSQWERDENKDRELILDALVIKNIPFAVKKEQVVRMMVDMGLPLPYAFNYHFDNGIFRGKAFAKFVNADEAATALGPMEYFEINGKRLEVEYKKISPVTISWRWRMVHGDLQRVMVDTSTHRPLPGEPGAIRRQRRNPDMAKMPYK
jgi:RNA recognition motif-containing protein